MDNIENTSEFLFYTSGDNDTRVQVIIDKDSDTVWTTQKGMSEIFNVEIPAISKHISNILQEGELQREGTVSKMEIVQKEGSRDVERSIDFYNLDMIIAVGYRVNSFEATQFRVWATKILREYLIKGFSLDDERLKQAKTVFGKDYFNELLERIREIRASERRFYQKITDIYATSVDYNPKAPITKTFFATVQNKLEFAITNHTASEIIKLRANSKEPNMGLTTWKQSKGGGKILKTDVSVAKNYLKQEEISELNSVVTMYLDYAELQANRNKLMKMQDWVDKLDGFLQFNEYNILRDAGKVKAAVAKKFAEKEFDKFRVVQDREYESDFDKVAGLIKSKNKIPSKKEMEETKEKLSDFNEKIKKALNHKPKDKGEDI